MPDFPNSQPVAELLKTHPEYRADLLAEYQDLYEGGARFEAHKARYLRRRIFEDSAGTLGQKQFERRLQSADYTPHAAGAIDWLCAALFQSAPQILAGEGTERVRAYWNRLNRDADGKGSDFEALLRACALQLLVHKRAYLAIAFPRAEPQAEGAKKNLAQQREAGELDGLIKALPAELVDDWEEDEAGKLLWIRTHSTRRLRSTPTGPADRLEHAWTYFTDAEVCSYAASQKLDPKGQPEAWAQDAEAQRRAFEPHELGRLPVVRIEIPRGLWIMNRLAPIAKALFNREAALAFSLDTSAYAQPVLKTEADINSVVGGEINCIKLRGATDDFRYVSPDASHYEAQAKNAEQLKTNLFLAIQAAALQAASKDEHGRQSGVAKFRDFGAIATLLSAYAAALRDAAEGLVERLKHLRGEDELPVTLTGLDKFDVQSLELKLKVAEGFLQLAGSYGSEAAQIAREWVMLDLSLAVTNAAPTELRGAVVQRAQQFLEKLKKGELPEAPAAAPPPPSTVPRAPNSADVRKVGQNQDPDPEP